MTDVYKRKRKLVTSMILVMVGILILSLAMTEQGRAQPLYGGILRIAYSADPAHLNRAIQSSSIIAICSRNILQGLVYVSPTFEIKPDLAESWDISADGLTYTFHLVKNATWHDGHNFTAEDVVFNIENVGPQYESTAKSAFSELESVVALDQYTVRCQFKSPPTGLLYFMGIGFLVVPKHLYEDTDIPSNEYNLKPVGTGPFKFYEWVKGSHITLVRNENYWRGGKPYLDRLIFKIIPDAAARALAAETGEVDYVPFYGFPFFAAETINGLPNWNVFDKTGEQGYSTILQLIPNLRHPILGNLSVRKALAHAIDKEFILQTAFFGYGKVATSFIPSSISWAYEADNPYADFDYNITMANQLLDDAGYPKDAGGTRFKINVVYDTATFEFTKAAEALRANFAELGVDLELMPLDRAGYVDKMAQWDFDTFLARFGQGPDPSRAARQYVSSNILKIAFCNNEGYNNSRIDELYELGGKEFETDERKPYYYEIQEILGEELPLFPINEVGFPVAYSDEFKNIVKGAFLKEEMDEAYWVGGYDVSPESAWVAIEEAEQTLENLKAQWYDVTEATEKLDDAKDAYSAGNYANAYALSQEAVALAVPPYYVYAIIAVVIIVVIIVAYYLYRKRKQ